MSRGPDSRSGWTEGGAREDPVEAPVLFNWHNFLGTRLKGTIGSVFHQGNEKSEWKRT